MFVGLVLTMAKNSRRNNYNPVSDMALMGLVAFKAVGIPLIVQTNFTPAELPYKVATTLGFVLVAQPFIKL